ncbi:MAG: DNA polymerase I [Candidatus Bipolaricaulota bacterium]
MSLLRALGLEDAPDRLLLVDAYSTLYRSFHALPELTTSGGEPIHAVYGLVRTLLMALKQYPARYLAVVFDSSGPTVRHEVFPEYKATRKEMPETLASQLPRAKALLDAMGVSRLELPRYEADDVMAALVERAKEAGVSALLLTGDKDMAQLVGEGVSLLRPGRRPTDRLEPMDASKVVERFGVPPERMVDLLALVGDKSDNVPGVRGVGEKGARELLARYGSLEEVLQAAGSHPNRRLGEALVRGRDEALRSRDLVCLQPPELAVDLESLVPAEWDPEALRSELQALEFKSVLSELGVTAAAARRQSRLVLDDRALSELVEELNRAEAFSLDLETTSPHPLSAELVGLALAVKPGEGWYVPVGHEGPDLPGQLPIEHVLDTLQPVLEADRPQVWGQNLKYDMQVLARYGVGLRGVSFDAMLAHWLLNPDAPSHGLEVIAREELGELMESYRDTVGGKESISRISPERAAAYAVTDAEVVCRLRKPLMEKLRQAEMERLLEDVEVPLIEVLAWIERRGIPLDVDELRRQGVELESMIERVREELFALAGGPFNPGSVPQVREVLYERLRLPVLSRTKTGPSTDAQVLRELAGRHELPVKLIAYRELEKLRNTYIEKLPKYVGPDSGRVHTSFNQTGTATGRLSSSEPNLQNIPSRHEVGVDIRRAFVAPSGRVFLAADYSQVELRVLAHFSGDEALQEAFRRGEDLHRRTAARLFGVSEKEVDERMRAQAKRVNFGIVYGISPYGLARDLGVPQGRAKELIDRFFAAYPQVKPFLDQLAGEAKRKGYACTLLGRRRLLSGSRGGRRVRGYDERNAVNTPIQGSAADVMKLAMLELHGQWARGELAADMVLQVHDSLVFEVDTADAESVGRQVRRVMEGVAELTVPLQVEVKTGGSWGDL